MGVVENLKDLAELAQKVGQIELQKKILEAEDQVREVTQEKRRLEDRVEELERALKLKNTMKFKAPFYYQEGDEVPFCPACYEKDGRAVHVVKNDDAEWYCNVCKTFYDGGPAFAIA
jgi:rubrerythrin